MDEIGMFYYNTIWGNNTICVERRMIASFILIHKTSNHSTRNHTYRLVVLSCLLFGHWEHILIHELCYYSLQCCTFTYLHLWMYLPCFMVLWAIVFTFCWFPFLVVHVVYLTLIGAMQGLCAPCRMQIKKLGLEGEKWSTLLFLKWHF